MGDATENTDELDSYGVWVKRPPQDSSEETIIPETEAETEIPEVVNESEDFDMPDFGEIPDTDDSSTEEQEVDLSEFGDFSSDSEDSNSSQAVTSAIEEISLDEFGDFSSGPEEASEKTPDNAISSETEEIDLNDFLDESSSSGDGEISLDDFLDGDSFSSESAAPKKEDDVSDDEALDINLDFDTPEEEIVPTEEIVEEEEKPEDTEDFFEEEEEIAEEKPEETTPSGKEDLIPMEEVSLDDFSLEESDASTADAAAAKLASKTDSEEIDISDFGLDDNSSDANLPNSHKQEVVDYDLAITDEDEISSTPAIKEIKTEAKAEEKETDTENTAINNDLLEQIISDLSGLKNEISALKNDLAVLKEKNSFEKEPGFSSAAEISDSVPEITEEEPQGFFGNSDEDETIALSGDELSNIMNSADFTEETVSEIPDESEKLEENAFLGSTEDSETPEVIEETETEIPVQEEILSEEVIPKENIVSDEVSLTDDLPEIENISADVFDDDITDDLLSEDATLSNEELDNIAEDASFDETIDISDENNPVEDIPETLPNDIIDEPVLEEEGSIVPVEDEFSIEEEPVLENEITTEEPVIIEETPSIEEEQGAIEDEIVTDETPVIEETSFVDENPVIEESTPVIEPDETVTDDFTADFTDDTPFAEMGELSDESNPLSDENESEISVNFDDDLISDSEIDENLPEEIDIPKVDDIAVKEETNVDDIMVESSASDFMDSVTSDEPESVLSENENIEDISIDDIAEEPVLEEEVPSVEEAVTEENPEPVSETIESEPDVAEVPEIDDEPLDIVFDEPSQEENNVIADIMSETPSINEALTEENVDYLEEDKPSDEINIADEPVQEEEKGDLPDDIKADVKSVLLYMDQLLENLPEEKIMEFARSEQFATYKKLFSELGLS